MLFVSTTLIAKFLFKPKLFYLTRGKCKFLNICKNAKQLLCHHTRGNSTKFLSADPLHILCDLISIISVISTRRLVPKVILHTSTHV